MLEILKRLKWDLSLAQTRDVYVSWILRDIPGEFGIMLRRKWYCSKFKKAGENINILPGSVIINPQQIECEDNVSIGYFNYLQATGGIILKKDVMLGPYVKIWSQTHNYKSYDVPVNKQGYNFSSVEIGEDVWIGANSFIMPGAKIGDKCIISACSVVSGKTYPQGFILAGYPARKIGDRRPGVEE